MDILSFTIAIVCYLALTFGSRNLAGYHDFVKLTLPKWLSRCLFIMDVRSAKISLMSIVFQTVVIIMMLLYLMNCIGVNVFAGLGGFFQVYTTLFRWLFFLVGIPIILYGLFCNYWFKRH